MLHFENLQLIDGKFIPENAREVLIDLIKSKIAFHERHKLDGDILFSRQRINELEDMLLLVESAIKEAIKKRKKLVINGFVDIKLVD